MRDIFYLFCNAVIHLSYTIGISADPDVLLAAQVCYLGYEEWESREQLHEYFRGDAHKDWMHFVQQNNIAAKVCMAVEIKDTTPFD